MRQLDIATGLIQTQDVSVDFDQARGHVSLYESENILLTEVVLKVPKSIRWTLKYDEDDVVFEGYRRFENKTGNITVSRSEMRVKQAGDARYLLFFTRKNHTVDSMVIKLFSSGRLILEKPLTPSGAA